MKNTKKTVVSLLVALALVVLAIPANVFAASYPNTYDVIFKAGNQVVKTERVSYIDSVEAPEYKDVDTWYCNDLKIEAQTGARVWADDFGMNREVVFQADSVLPDTFTLVFDANGKIVKEVTVEACGWGSYEAIDFVNPSRFLLPDEEWGFVPADAWVYEDEANHIELRKGDYVSGQDLDLDNTWFEVNPVITFTLK